MTIIIDRDTSYMKDDNGTTKAYFPYDESYHVGYRIKIEDGKYPVEFNEEDLGEDAPSEPTTPSQPAKPSEPATKKPTQPTKVSVKTTKLKSVKNAKGKKMTIKWVKNTAGNGYQIQYSTSKKFAKGNKTKTISKNKTTSYTSKKLKKKKTYYVRIRTSKKVSGKTYYSGWSSVKKVKIKK